MEKRNKVLNQIIEQAILPAFYHPDPEVSLTILNDLYRNGFRAVEYSNRNDAAIQNFLHLRKAANKQLPGLQLGAALIKNTIDATEYINEGADFIIATGVMKDIRDIAHRNDVLWVPTCMSMTEITIAEELDGRLVKLFPANVLGPSQVSALKEIFPDLYFMAADDPELNIGLSSWYRSGISVVGLKHSYTSKKVSEPKDYSRLETSVKNASEIINYRDKVTT